MMTFRTPASSGTSHATPQVLELTAGDALSPHGRRLAWTLTLVLLLGGLALLSASAATRLTGVHPGSPTTVGARSGAPGSVPGTGPADDVVLGGGVVEARWDGPTTHLDWTGSVYTTAEATFVGDRVASPGDRVQRTLRIGNAGPADGLMTVSLVLDGPSGDAPVADDFAEAVRLFWDVGGVDGDERFSTLSAADRAEPVVAEVRVPRGEVVPVTVGFAMPAEVTGATASDSAGPLGFHVQVRLQGDTEAPGVVSPEVPGLAVTGAGVLGVLALLLGLVGLGWLLTVAGRRRRCAGCGSRLVRGDRWTEQHAEDGTSTARCAPCQVVAATDEVHRG